MSHVGPAFSHPAGQRFGITIGPEHRCVPELNHIGLILHVAALCHTTSLMGEPPGVRQKRGAPGANRTRDNLLRRQVLYPTELRAPPIFTGLSK